MSRQDARYVVIFKATIKALDAEYSATAQRMRENGIGNFR